MRGTDFPRRTISVRSEHGRYRHATPRAVSRVSGLLLLLVAGEKGRGERRSVSRLRSSRIMLGRRWRGRHLAMRMAHGWRRRGLFGRAWDGESRQYVEERQKVTQVKKTKVTAAETTSKASEPNNPP